MDVRLAAFLIDYALVISKILKPGLSLLLYAIEGLFLRYHHVVQTWKHGLTMCEIDDAVIAAIDNGIENHVYSDHIITHHFSHPDNRTNTSTRPNFCPSISHLVVFWGVVAHLVVFFLSLMYQCCMNWMLSNADTDNIIMINDDDNTQSHGE